MMENGTDDRMEMMVHNMVPQGLFAELKCRQDGTATDMDAYDAAAPGAVVLLSVQSAGPEAAPVDCPDFTRGRWSTTPPLPIVHT